PDSKILAGGWFFEVGGYARHQIVRLTADGRVDRCFDPGLGLGFSGDPGPVRSISLQADGRIVLGGSFYGVDTAYGQGNVARLLPQSECDIIRTYLIPGYDPGIKYVAATLPPFGTNVLERSEDLH